MVDSLSQAAETESIADPAVDRRTFLLSGIAGGISALCDQALAAEKNEVPTLPLWKRPDGFIPLGEASTIAITDGEKTREIAICVSKDGKVWFVDGKAMKQTVTKIPVVVDNVLLETDKHTQERKLKTTGTVLILGTGVVTETEKSLREHCEMLLAGKSVEIDVDGYPMIIAPAAKT